MNADRTQNHNSEILADEWISNTILFQRWKAMKREILLHKWYESEKAGHDVGWEKASTNWMIHFSRGFDFNRQGDQNSRA